MWMNVMAQVCILCRAMSVCAMAWVGVCVQETDWVWVSGYVCLCDQRADRFHSSTMYTTITSANRCVKGRGVVDRELVVHYRRTCDRLVDLWSQQTSQGMWDTKVHGKCCMFDVPELLLKHALCTQQLFSTLRTITDLLSKNLQLCHRPLLVLFNRLKRKKARTTICRALRR